MVDRRAELERKKAKLAQIREEKERKKREIRAMKEIQNSLEQGGWGRGGK